MMFGEVLAWIPHNNLLLVWMSEGPLGVAALAVAICFSIAASVRLFQRSRDPMLRILAFTGFSLMVQWTLYIWADMAFSFARTVMLPGVVTGMAFKMLHIVGRRNIAPWKRSSATVLRPQLLSESPAL